MVDQKLRDLLQKPEEEIAWLSKLSIEEQQKLAEWIEEVVAEHHNTLYAIIGFVSNLLPAFIRARVAEKLGPKTVAMLSSMVSTKQAVEVAERLSPRFLADVSAHLRPDLVVEIIEATKDQLLVSITKILIEKGRFPLLARFSDHLSPKKLKTLAMMLNSPRDIVQIANLMQNKDRMIETALTMDDGFLIRLMKEVSFFGYFELAALVGQRMPIDRQLRLLDQLSAYEAGRIAKHYPPQLIAQIAEKIEDQKRNEISLAMDEETWAKTFPYLSSKLLNKMIPHLPLDRIEKVIPHVSLKDIEAKWPTFTTETKAVFERLAQTNDWIKTAMKQWA